MSNGVPLLTKRPIPPVAVETTVNRRPTAQIRAGSIVHTAPTLDGWASTRTFGSGCKIRALGIHRPTRRRNRAQGYRPTFAPSPEGAEPVRKDLATKRVQTIRLALPPASGQSCAPNTQRAPTVARTRAPPNRAFLGRAGRVSRTGRRSRHSGRKSTARSRTQWSSIRSPACDCDGPDGPEK